MKIAILSYFSGVHDRGVETWAKNIKEKLQRKADIEIISKRGNESILANTIRSYKQWSKADFIIPTGGRLQVLICRLGAWLNGKPLIVFGHSGPGADDKWNLLCSPNIFVAFSDSQKKWADKFKLPWTRVEMIPHAVDINRFKPAPKKPGKKIILCVAANSPDKRINLVRKAVEKLPGYKLIAVGKGNEREVSFQEMPGIYRYGDVFCFTPQNWEAFGLVFLEAMATNLPVVTVDDPVRREIIGGAGYFVENPEDTDKLALAIKEAYDKDWRDIPRRQAEKFSWDKILKKYQELFNL